MADQARTIMDRFQSVMEKTVVPIGMKISQQRHLAAVRDGMMAVIGATIVGGFAMLLAMPPVPTGLEATNPFFAFLLAWQAWATANMEILIIPYYLTIGIISLYVVAGVSYQLARTYKLEPLNNMVNALAVFLCVSDTFDVSTASITVGNLGASYMFGAFIIALVVVEISHQCNKHHLTIKLPDAVPPNVAAPFNMLIPLVICVVGIGLANQLVIAISGAGITGLAYTIFQPLLSVSDSLPSLLIIQTIATLFWFFGIHGSSMVGIVVNPITTAALAANIEAYQAGEAMPYIWGPSLTGFFGNFPIYLAMVILCLTVCKSERLKAIGKISLPTTLFNINEPMIFGLPMVLNVYILIPLIVGSIVNLSSYYLLASANIVGRIYISVPSTIPAPLQALLRTMDPKVLVLWIVIFIVDMLIAFPFMKTYDNQVCEEEEAARKAEEAEAQAA